MREYEKVTLDKVLDVLENDTNEVFVDEELAQCALKPLNKMLELARNNMINIKIHCR